MSSVDVVIPCYRYGHFLRECVESVLTQKINRLRVLIIDDASPDNTPHVASALIRKDSRVTYVRHSTNKGHIATYNEGIDWASADYMLILSADDYLLSGALCRAQTVFDRHPEVGLVFGRAVTLRDGGVISLPGDALASEWNWRIMSGAEFIRFMGCRNRVPTPTAVVRTELQKRIGGYEPALPHSGDMEMWLRFACHAPVAEINKNQAVYRRHQANMSLDYYKRNWLPDVHQRLAAIVHFRALGGPELPNPSLLNDHLLRLLALEALNFAHSAFNEGDIEEAGSLSSFAVSICPSITVSRPWLSLLLKNHIGLRIWTRTVYPTYSRLKGWTGRLGAGSRHV
jgi:hypothetical protein